MNDQQEDKIRDSLREFAIERAENYVEMYLPGWVLSDWDDSDTNFLAVYLLGAMTEAVVRMEEK